MKKTYGSCFREFIADKHLDESDKSFTGEELKNWFAHHYPDLSDLDNQFPKKTTNYSGRVRWKPRPNDDLFFHLGDAQFRRYQPATDPAPFYASSQPLEGGYALEIGLRTGSYNYRQCQSLFGYAKDVHERSGCICQLCGCGSGEEIPFELWRQMTVEHLIGRAQGGYLPQVRQAITQRFPELPAQEQEKIARCIDEMNTITACQFCNSTTSQSRHEKSMTRLIRETEGDVEQFLSGIMTELRFVLERKQADIQWKLQAVRKAFDEHVRPSLIRKRSVKG